MPCSPKGAAIMTRKTLLALAAATALVGCGNENHNIVAGGEPPDDTANAPTNAAMPLPPSIAASKIYRCADSKVIYVDWMSDGSARVKASRGEVGTAVPPNSPGLKGNAEASAIIYNGQSCKA